MNAMYPSPSTMASMAAFASAPFLLYAAFDSRCGTNQLVP